VARLKGAKRQKNQLELAFGEGMKSEARSPSSEGTEAPVAKRSAESLAPDEQWIEKVCQRENLWQAFKRVKGNGGSPGVDGMTVDDFADYLKQHWITGSQPGVANAYLHRLAGDNETSHGTAQNVGRVGEDVAEFVLGDAALKGLSVSDRLLQASKYAKMVEESPILTRLFQAGVRAARGGVVGTAQGAVKSRGNVGDALASGAAGGIGNAVVPEAVDAIKAAPGAIRAGVGALSDYLHGAEAVVQPELQGSLRKILADVAADHGITIPDGTAMRDTAEHVGQAIKGKASALYQSIDDALGGQDFKSVNRQLDNAQRALRQDTGIDHDATGDMIEHINALEDKKAQLREDAISAGVDPKAFAESDRLWRQGSALQDLSAKIRQSTSGLPDNLQDGSKAASQANGEVVSPSKLAGRIHSLRDPGRLSQALTQDLSQARGNDLLKAAEAAKARTAEIANRNKLVGHVAKGAAYAVGAGGAGAGLIEGARHLAGNQ
jgi:hypothetical protein